MVLTAMMQYDKIVSDIRKGVELWEDYNPYRWFCSLCQ
jgi:hypothetical protein